MRRFFSGAYAKFWNALLAGSAVGAGSVFLQAAVVAAVGWNEDGLGPTPADILAAVDNLWTAIAAALGAAIAANIEPSEPPEPRL